MRNTIPVEERLEVKKKTHKNMMWLAIAAIVMMFIGFSSGYVVAKGDATWVHIKLPSAFYISSVVIILSSITFFFGVRFAKKGNSKMSSIFVLVTLILGFVFVKYQIDGWGQLREKGMNFVDVGNVKKLVESGVGVYGEDYWVVESGNELKYVDGKFYDVRDTYNSNPILPRRIESKNNASSFLFLLTGLHVAHLLGGLISLIVVTIKSLRGKYTVEDTVGIEVSSIYWHFLDFLWLYLLGLLYFVG